MPRWWLEQPLLVHPLWAAAVALSMALLAWRHRRAARNMAAEYQRAGAILAQRTGSLDQLLEFSQILQGAGHSQQVYSALCHYLPRELGLAGLALVSWEPQATPAVSLLGQWPQNLLQSGRSISELDVALCPCLRQNLAREYRAEASPLRCGIEAFLAVNLQAATWCYPFIVGEHQHVAVHMILPPGRQWDQSLKHLAQTYLNTAYSTLTSLHLLQEAQRRSLTDPLTGLFNRRSLEQLLQREVALAERHGQNLSLVMIDLDHFKKINDTFGHAAGDHLLKCFADCVRITLRKTDMAFRYGGDEFVIALPQTPIAQAQQVVQKLRQAFAAVDFTEAITHLDQPPTLSIGVAQRDAAQNILTFTQLLQAADSALYDAKHSNRNCVRTYQPPYAA